MYSNYRAPLHHPPSAGYLPQISMRHQQPPGHQNVPSYPYANSGQQLPANTPRCRTCGAPRYPASGTLSHSNNGTPTEYHQPAENPYLTPPGRYPGQGFHSAGVLAQYQSVNLNPGNYPSVANASATFVEYLMPYQQRPSIKEGHFDPLADAANLYKSMKGLGAIESAIINVISKRTGSQRQQIVSVYISTFGQDLIQDLKNELSGRFEDAAIALMTRRADYLAKKLNAAMVGAGTREKTLIDILCLADNHEIRRINESYQWLFSKSLESSIKENISGYFRKLLVMLTKISLLQGCRSEDPKPDIEAAEADAKELTKAGESKLGSDGDVFSRIFTTRSFPQLRLIGDEYLRISGKSMESTIKSGFSGHIEKALLAILRCARNRAAYFAERLNDSIAGLATNDDDLIFIVVSRADIDMENIKEEYQKLYKKSLEKHISSDTIGDSKKLLLSIIGA